MSLRDGSVGERDLVAAALDGAADEFLVFVRAVDVGGVEKEDAAFQRAANGSDRFGVVAGPVETCRRVVQTAVPNPTITKPRPKVY